MIKISIIIPTINEEKAIGRVICEIPLSLLKKKYDVEVLVIDGSSTDNTAKIAQSLGAKVINEERKGYGRAYKTGFEHATGDIIVTVDGDNTYPVSIIFELVEKLEAENLDFITTNRFKYMDKESVRNLHKIGNAILTYVTRTMFSVDIHDSQSGMWIFRKKILDRLSLTSDGMPFSEEIKIEAYTKGLRCAEIPIRYRTRIGEVKLKSYKDGYKNIKFLLLKKFNRT